MDVTVQAAVAGIVWKIEVKPGDRVAASDPVVILECMKMEIPLLTDAAGTVREVLVAEGDIVSEGDPVAVVSAD
jgi:biotin carboxyl carrier protein